jgi:hypothetical protein
MSEPRRAKDLSDGQCWILVRVAVPEDWEGRADMQCVLEREIHADRWSWEWPAANPDELTDEERADCGLLSELRGE